MPRSGTSLIDQILSKHLNIKALGELECLGDLINKLDLINSNLQKKKEIVKKSYIETSTKKISSKLILLTKHQLTIDGLVIYLKLSKQKLFIFKEAQRQPVGQTLKVILVVKQMIFQIVLIIL